MGGSRRCIRRSMAGCSPCATTKRMSARSKSTRSRRSTCSSSISIPSSRRSASGADFATCIETIDIGGPALIRAGAKNHASVTVVTEPADYAARARRDGRAMAARRRWPCANRSRPSAFARTAAYDAAIASWFASVEGEQNPARRVDRRHARRGASLRREPASMGGLLPHGRAALRRRHRDAAARQGALLQQSQRHRRGLRAGRRVRSRASAAVAIIKHANPCGVAIGATLAEAYAKALACDPVSAFGGIVALNRPLDAEAAREIVKIFTEVIIAPDASDEAKAILAEKKNLRLLLAGGLPDPRHRRLHLPLARRRLPGAGARRRRGLADRELKVVTKRKPTKRNWPT